MAQRTAKAVACDTENRKLTAGQKGRAYATMAAQASCPASCPLRHSGCYAESGPQGIATARLNRNASDKDSPEEIATEEAEAIRMLPDKARPLRLHVVGDAATDKAAAILADACAERTGPAWTYTHAWRTVERAAWGTVSVLASCESDMDVADAESKGYATCRIIARDKVADMRSAVGAPRPRDIVCPHATHGVCCVDCGLCWNDTRLRERRSTILFPAHGSGARKAESTIKGE